jgi:hypothetical protein
MLKDPKMILATDKNNNDITIELVEEWLNRSAKIELADFFVARLYGRYLKSFDFQDDEYIENYKSGFAIMASCCLLIETFVSYVEPIFLDTHSKSERCFGYFFLSNSEFSQFSKNGLTLSEYLNLSIPLIKKGTPSDFFTNVRCGILHNGETRNGWKIVRSGELYDETNKKINATKFMNNLTSIIHQFGHSLKFSDFRNDAIWNAFKLKIKFIIQSSYKN